MENLIERPHERTAPASTGEPEGAGGLASAQSAMAAMLAAGDEIIKKSLSEDSEAFLRANRQQGGQ